MRIVLAAMLMLGLVACKTKPDHKDPLAELAKACEGKGELSCSHPIFNVASLRASQAYYRDALGFKIDWDHGDPPNFGSVSRGHSAIFMCERCQGHPGAWMMIFTPDVDRLYQEFVEHHAIIQRPPTNEPWGMREMQVADPDGNVMRFGMSLDHDAD
jgi:catechol 2,3-dioxygenase-like lactoylglutathione lyase family enzyme